MLLSVISLKKYWCFSLQIKMGVDLESSKQVLPAVCTFFEELI